MVGGIAGGSEGCFCKDYACVMTYYRMEYVGILLCKQLRFSLCRTLRS